MADDRAKRGFEDETQYHRREWRIQRVGWTCMALFLAAALVGVFGNGPVSEVNAAAGPGTLVTYERFARHGSKTSLRIVTSEHGEAGSTLTVSFSREFIEDLRIESITPEPSEMRTTTDAVQFSFSVSSPNTQAIFWLEPERLGANAGEVQIGSVPVRISQFVYP